jgi:hypothetical protein
MPVSAGGVEQAIPRVSTLDWGGKTPRRESERKGKVLFNAEPRSLSAEGARPPQSRGGSPTHPADRNVTVLLVDHSQGQKQHELALCQGRENCGFTHAVSP